LPPSKRPADRGDQYSPSHAERRAASGSLTVTSEADRMTRLARAAPCRSGGQSSDQAWPPDQPSVAKSNQVRCIRRPTAGVRQAAERVQPSAQMTVVVVVDVHDLAAMHRAPDPPPAASTTRDRTGKHRSARAHCRRRRTPKSGRRTSRQHRWPPARGGVGSRGRPPAPAPGPREPAERSRRSMLAGVVGQPSTACPRRTATPRVGWCR